MVTSPSVPELTVRKVLVLPEKSPAFMPGMGLGFLFTQWGIFGILNQNFLIRPSYGLTTCSYDKERSRNEADVTRCKFENVLFFWTPFSAEVSVDRKKNVRVFKVPQMVGWLSEMCSDSSTWIELERHLSQHRQRQQAS